MIVSLKLMEIKLMMKFILSDFKLKKEGMEFQFKIKMENNLILELEAIKLTILFKKLKI